MDIIINMQTMRNMLKLQLFPFYRGAQTISERCKYVLGQEAPPQGNIHGITAVRLLAQTKNERIIGQHVLQLLLSYLGIGCKREALLPS